MVDNSTFELASIQYKKETDTRPEDKKIDVIEKGKEVLGYKVFLGNSQEGAMRWLVIMPDAEQKKVEEIRTADSRLSVWPDGEPMMVLSRTKSYGEGEVKPKKEYTLTKPDDAAIELASKIIGQ